MYSIEKILKYNADAGNTHAQYTLGDIYYDDDGVEQDYVAAFQLYEKAALQGHIEAQHMLGLMYLHGDGVEQNFIKAYDSFEKAAKNGNIFAQYSLDGILFRGHDMNIDTELKLAKNGNPEAQRVIAIRYDDGYGVEQDDIEASKWFEKAAKQGDPFSLLRIGMKYSEENSGVKKDLKKARQFFEEAINKGNKLATFALQHLDNISLKKSNVNDKTSKTNKTKTPKR